MKSLVWAGVTVAGGATVALGLRFLPSALRRPPHLRSNYRGRPVLGTAGLILVLPLSLGVAAAAVVPSGGMRVALAAGGAGMTMAALGLLDDVYGDRGAGGFRGHLMAMWKGRLTTGGAKAVGGGVVGLAAAWAVGHRGLWIVVAGAVIALTTNLVNLLDARPGRALKVWLPAAVALVGLGTPGESERVVVALAGGAAVFAVHELREKVMLGDTGAGLLGGSLGVLAASVLAPAPLLALLGGIALLNLASEFVSFTRITESVGVLRWIDSLGRRP